MSFPPALNKSPSVNAVAAKFEQKGDPPPGGGRDNRGLTVARNRGMKLRGYDTSNIGGQSSGHSLFNQPTRPPSATISVFGSRPGGQASPPQLPPWASRRQKAPPPKHGHGHAPSKTLQPLPKTKPKKTLTQKKRSSLKLGTTTAAKTGSASPNTSSIAVSTDENPWKVNLKPTGNKSPIAVSDSETSPTLTSISSAVVGAKKNKKRSSASNTGKGKKKSSTGSSGQPRAGMNFISAAMDSTATSVEESGQSGQKFFKEEADDVKVKDLDEAYLEPLLHQMNDGSDCMHVFSEALHQFAKQQATQSRKFLQLIAKSRNKYASLDAMANFTFTMELVHTLLEETVKHQLEFATFIEDSCMPIINTLEKSCESEYKRLATNFSKNEKNLQTVRDEVEKLKKQTSSAAESAVKSRQQKTEVKKDTSAKSRISALKFKNIVNLATSSSSTPAPADTPQLDATYVRAKELEKKLKASVSNYNSGLKDYCMNYSKDRQSIINMEHFRIDSMLQVFKKLVTKQQQITNDRILMNLQADILTKVGHMDPRFEITQFVSFIVEKYGKYEDPDTMNASVTVEYRDMFLSLQDAMAITLEMDPTAKIPFVVPLMCKKVKEHKGFETEGIFRKSPSKSAVRAMKEQLAKKDLNLTNDNVHVYASLLKDWLRGLSDPVIPELYYDFCVDMAKSGKLDKGQFEVFFSQLPSASRETLRYLVNFLRDLIKPQYSKKTKMGLENIAIVFGPTLLRTRGLDATEAFANAQSEQEFVVALIEKS